MQPDAPSPPPTSSSPNPNPNPYHPLQALHFLRLLAKINGSRSSQAPQAASAPTTSVRRRSICIRGAAYASMAYAVGPRRAWSRTLLRRLRRRGRSRQVPVARRVRRDGRVVVVTTGGSKPASETTRTDELRRLVPGAWSLDICSLLDETRHYIQCLSSQQEFHKEYARKRNRSPRTGSVNEKKESVFIANIFELNLLIRLSLTFGKK